MGRCFITSTSLTLVLMLISVHAYPFLAFSYLTCHLFICLFSIYLLLTILFQLQLEEPSTNSKTCLKPLVQSTKLQNVGIIDTRHLRHNLHLWCLIKVKPKQNKNIYIMQPTDN